MFPSEVKINLFLNLDIAADCVVSCHHMNDKIKWFYTIYNKVSTLLPLKIFQFLIVW